MISIFAHCSIGAIVTKLAYPCAHARICPLPHSVTKEWRQVDLVIVDGFPVNLEFIIRRVSTALYIVHVILDNQYDV